VRRKSFPTDSRSVLRGTVIVPESPRWLANHGRKEECHDVVARLVGLPHDHSEVMDRYNAIVEGVEFEKSVEVRSQTAILSMKCSVPLSDIPAVFSASQRPPASASSLPTTHSTRDDVSSSLVQFSSSSNSVESTGTSSEQVQAAPSIREECRDRVARTFGTWSLLFWRLLD
jgi:hypothetical protein